MRHCVKYGPGLVFRQFISILGKTKSNRHSFHFVILKDFFSNMNLIVLSIQRHLSVGNDENQDLLKMSCNLNDNIILVGWFARLF